MACACTFFLLEHTAQGGQAVFTHHVGCRPEGAPVGGSASLHNSGTGWWHALQADRALRGVLPRWWVETGIGLRGWVSGWQGPQRTETISGLGRSQCMFREALPRGFPPACLHCTFGQPQLLQLTGQGIAIHTMLDCTGQDETQHCDRGLHVSRL